jgi:hypothetical protein
MAFGYCVNCRFWKAKDSVLSTLNPVRAIYGMCDAIDGPYGLEEARYITDETLAGIAAYEFDGCELQTRPTFGCAEFQPKEK